MTLSRKYSTGHLRPSAPPPWPETLVADDRCDSLPPPLAPRAGHSDEGQREQRRSAERRARCRTQVAARVARTTVRRRARERPLFLRQRLRLVGQRDRDRVTPSRERARQIERSEGDAGGCAEAGARPVPAAGTDPYPSIGIIRRRSCKRRGRACRCVRVERRATTEIEHDERAALDRPTKSGLIVRPPVTLGGADLDARKIRDPRRRQPRLGS